MKNNQSKIPRLFLDGDLTERTIGLAGHHSHYLRRVLRLKAGDSLMLFNGLGEERQAVVETLAREHARLRLARAVEPLPESPLELALVQAVAKSDAMDLIVQKSTELGVRDIFPVLTEFSVVRLDEQRAARRTEHWRRIAQSACEQSGRHYVPHIHHPQGLLDCLARVPPDHLKVALHPGSQDTLQRLDPATQTVAKLSVLIGPEGGLSAGDLAHATQAGFHRVSLGPRTLRTETAAVAACTLAQARWGDLAT